MRTIVARGLVSDDMWYKMTSKLSTDERHRNSLAMLRPRGQDHVLRWWEKLPDPQRQHLLSEIESIPWDAVEPLIQTHILSVPDRVVRGELLPPQVYPGTPTPREAALYEEAKRLGRKLLAEGKIAAFTVAGGQGTRLGFEGPKGCVTVSPVREKTLFQLFAEMIKAAGERSGVRIPWYVMTNPAIHEQTVGFLKDHEFFGLDGGDVFLFPQAMLPVFDYQGKILLSDKHRLALAPDGHGGSLKSLVSSGALRDMQSRGIEIISYFQVDNPLVKPFDALFIGLHALTESDMSTKVAAKVDDLERVGNVCLHDGRITVIEYTDFPEHLARERNPDGSRRFNVGNLAIHCLNVSFVQRIIADTFQLPYHRAEKVTAWMDEHGFLRTPSRPNSVKVETFVFDALPLARNPLLLEVDRAEEFSPVKNITGADSVETAIRDQIRRAARWLEAAGAPVPRKPDGEPNVSVEISPLFALDPEEVAAKKDRIPSLKHSAAIYIE